MTKRLNILENSLVKKEAILDDRFERHFTSVKQANGQPLNDKRNGQATLNQWDRQSEAIRNQKGNIAKTEQAIEKEKGKIANVEWAKGILPSEILEMIETGQLIQWRKHPCIFFVKGVDKARIIWDEEKKIVSNRYVRAVNDKEQLILFANAFYKLRDSINN